MSGRVRLILWSVGQVFSGGLVFYGSAVILPLFLIRESARIPAILFTLLVPAAFSALTLLWYEVARHDGKVPRPELSLMFGLNHLHAFVF
jgi:hypothetical protein